VGYLAKPTNAAVPLARVGERTAKLQQARMDMIE